MNEKGALVMFHMRYATLEDKNFWFTLDKHLSEKEYRNKILLDQCYIIEEDNKCIGVFRYNLFWDTIPFLNLIYIDWNYHRRGLGSKAMLYWEDEMRLAGYELVMTSTMVDEVAQHFYRKLNYKDCGCLVKDFPPLVETMEMFMMKSLIPK
jgi:GNAT superfamily N-acetyltransferase